MTRIYLNIMRLTTINSRYVMTSIALVGGTYFLYKLYYNNDKDGVIVIKNDDDSVFTST